MTKRCLIATLVAILSLTSVLIAGCGNAERDKAVTFYRGAYPISKEIRQITDDWNAFLQQFSKRKVTNQEILGRVQGYVARLEILPKNLSMLYAPTPLRQLKDDIASAINSGIDGFNLYQQYAVTNDMNYAREADSKLMESSKLLMRAADEWDDGLAHYKIKPSEIIR